MTKSTVKKLNQAAQDFKVPKHLKGKQKGEYFKAGGLEMLDMVAAQFGMRLSAKTVYQEAMKLKL
jgi:hypothetical protein